jgi:hypothetical protein
MVQGERASLSKHTKAPQEKKVNACVKLSDAFVRAHGICAVRRHSIFSPFEAPKSCVRQGMSQSAHSISFQENPSSEMLVTLVGVF